MKIIFTLLFQRIKGLGEACWHEKLYLWLKSQWNEIAKHLFVNSKYKKGTSSNYEEIIKLQGTICGDFHSYIYIDYM